MFSKIGEYEAVGLFSTTHIVSIIVCFVFVALLVVLTRKMSKQTYFKVLKVFAVVVTVLEIVKILLTWFESNFNLNAWLPLFFCSLFIFSLWFTCFKNQSIKSLGLSYIAFASIIAGVAFIIFPTTSFTMYPIFHFKCIHSLIYHCMMIYSGIMLYVTDAFEVDLKAVLKYTVFCLSFMVLALIVNINFGSNLMFISNPGNVPVPILHTIYNYSAKLFTITMMFVHIVLMGFCVLGVVKLVKHFKNKNNNIEESALDELQHEVS